MMRSEARSGWSRQDRRDFLKGMLFISPWLIGFLAFNLYPMASSLYYSFTRYEILRPPSFVGLENFQRMFVEDDVLRKVLGNTLFMVVFGVPLRIIFAFLVASMLNAKLRFRSLFRTLFFIPAIVPVVASAMVWLWVLNVQFGVINAALVALGFEALPFLSSQTMVKPTIVMIHVWGSGQVIVIFLAALQDVPRSLYDAAKVDGANLWHQFRHVTVPLCTPAIYFAFITNMIVYFQLFAFTWNLTRGGPNRASEFYNMYIYKEAFQNLHMGYASALAWGLFVVVIAIAILTHRSSDRWVFYGAQ